MASLRTVAFALAGVAVASFLTSLVLAVAPPDPGCGGKGVYCEEAAFDRLRTVVVLLGVLGVVILLAALGVYYLHLQRLKRAPPPAALPTPAAGVAFTRPAAPPKAAEPPGKPPSVPRRPSR